MSPLWAGKRRWRQKHSYYKGIAATKRSRRGVDILRALQRDWVEEHAEIGAALSSVSWDDIRRIQGISTYEQQTLYRLKLRRLTRWNTASDSMICPHEMCNDDTSSSYAHIFWGCPTAKKMWDIFLAGWAGANGHTGFGTVSEIFSLNLNLPPESILAHFTKSDTGEAVEDVVYDVSNRYWKAGICATLATIWRSRIDEIKPNALLQQNNGGVAAGLPEVLRRTYSQLTRDIPLTPHTYGEWRVSRQLMNKLCDGTSSPGIGLTLGHKLDFFHGHSNQNPGSGGGGFFLISDGEPRSIRGGSVYLPSSRSTTNLTAMVSLYHLLVAASANNMYGLAIVGDNQHVVRYMSDRKPPNAGRLQRWYLKCRRLADKIRVSTWALRNKAVNTTATRLAAEALRNQTSFLDASRTPPTMAYHQPSWPRHLKCSSSHSLNIDRNLL